MIKFDHTKIRFQYVNLKSVTTALGGAIRVQNEEDETKFDRIQIPFAVARAFIKANDNKGNWLIPIEACIVWYDDLVVMIERGAQVRQEYAHTRIDLDGNPCGWKCSAEHNFETFVVPQVSEGKWYTDGTVMYKLPEKIKQAVSVADKLTACGTFRGLSVTALKFSDMDRAVLIENPATMSVVACVFQSGDYILTPPIWKNVLDIRNNHDDVKDHSHRFDKLNESFHVNLEFALNGGKTVGEVFGFDHIGPLQLDKLMVALTTVNLPKVKKSIRATYPIGMPFLHAFAWVAGLTEKCTSLADYCKMRQLLKHLCTKGIFDKAGMERIFKKGVEHSPKTLSKEQVAAQVQLIDHKDLREFWESRGGERSQQVGSDVAARVTGNIQE